MPGERLELSCPNGRGILSPLRLPFRHPGRPEATISAYAVCISRLDVNIGLVVPLSIGNNVAQLPRHLGTPGLFVQLAKRSTEADAFSLEDFSHLFRSLLQVANFDEVLVHEYERGHGLEHALVQVPIHDVEILIPLNDTQVNVGTMPGDLGQYRDIVEGVAAAVVGED